MNPQDQIADLGPKPAKVVKPGTLKPAVRRRVSPRTEIVRSFSFKLNTGNYQSVDFFCSQKSECSLDDAADVGVALYEFCKAQVMQSVAEYRKELADADRGIRR